MSSGGDIARCVVPSRYGVLNVSMSCNKGATRLGRVTRSMCSATGSFICVYSEDHQLVVSTVAAAQRQGAEGRDTASAKGLGLVLHKLSRVSAGGHLRFKP
jgi:hypothetical protein